MFINGGGGGGGDDDDDQQFICKGFLGWLALIGHCPVSLYFLDQFLINSQSFFHVRRELLVVRPVSKYGIPHLISGPEGNSFISILLYFCFAAFQWDPKQPRLALCTANNKLYMWSPAGCVSVVVPTEGRFIAQLKVNLLASLE